MKISWKVKPGNPHYWEIWVEEEKWREGHRSIFGRKPAFPSCSSPEELPAVFDAFEYRRVKGYVLWRLSQQSYHSEQLRKLLQGRFVQPPTIEKVIQELKGSGYLDDRAWLQGFMRGQERRYGLPLILLKLRAKGLSSSTLQTLAAEWERDPQQEIEAIQHLLKTRYRSKDLTQYKEKQKVVAALLRKGYSFEQIHQAFISLNNY